MLKNILFHLLICIFLSYATAHVLTELDSYCESMCGLYYITSTMFLLPLLFLLGLPIPIGLKKYPKGISNLVLKRKLALTFGLVGMLSVIAFYSISSYQTISKETVIQSHIVISFISSTVFNITYDIPFS